jgi:HD domain
VSQPAAASQQSALLREIAGIRIPDSARAKKAVDLSLRVSPAVVHAHVMRTFVFGALVGQARKPRYDEELFFLAAVLHDLGLTRQFRGLERFEVVGADAADAFLKDQCVNLERREIIWDAIALHTANAHVPGCPCPSLESQLKTSLFKE